MRGTFRICRIFPVLVSNRWFRKSDRPACYDRLYLSDFQWKLVPKLKFAWSFNKTSACQAEVTSATLSGENSSHYSQELLFRKMASIPKKRARKRAEYCFESTVSEERTHWASLSFTANSVSSAKNSVSSLWHTHNRPRGTHWVRSPELSEPQKTHWVRCLKLYSPKPYSTRLRIASGAPLEIASFQGPIPP